MKKVAKKSIVLAGSIILIIVGVIIYDLFLSDFYKMPDVNIDGKTNFINAQADRKKYPLINNKPISAKYSHTYNKIIDSKNEIEKKYCTYDIYYDYKGTEYIYLKNTNILAGILLKDTYGDPTPQKNAVKEERAIEVAKKTLQSIYSDFSEYCFDGCAYDSSYAIYRLVYVKKIAGYKSDDEINVWVNKDGKFVSFSAFNKDKNDKLINLKVNKETCLQKLKDKIKYKYTIKRQTISTDGNGLPVMAFLVYENRPELYMNSLITYKIPIS